MVYPQLVAAYTAVFALIFLVLSIQVVVGRGRTGIVHGDGGHELLNRLIRTHGNFAEYVPYILFMAALLEAKGTGPLQIHALLLPLLIARLMHPIGMRQPTGSRAQYAWRATSTTVTWVVLLAVAVMLVAVL